MNKKVLLLFVTAMLSIMGAKADVIPSSYYSEPAAGTYYLYNVTAGKFLRTVGVSEKNYSLLDAPVAVTLTSKGETICNTSIYFNLASYIFTVHNLELEISLIFSISCIFLVILPYLVIVGYSYKLSFNLLAVYYFVGRLRIACSSLCGIISSCFGSCFCCSLSSWFLGLTTRSKTCHT